VGLLDEKKEKKEKKKRKAKHLSSKQMLSLVASPAYHDT
jgi:hypothetical protein